MTDTTRPEGPIWIDMADMLADMSVRQLIYVANLSLNRLTMRDIGEIGHLAGVSFELTFADKNEPDHG